TALGLAQQGAGDHANALTHLQAALGYFSDGTLSDQTERGALVLALGKSQVRLNDRAGARHTFTQALDWLRARQDRLHEAEALHLLGTVENVDGNRAEAVALWMQAIRLFESEGRAALAARVLCDLGNARRMQGDLNAAMADFENALVMLGSMDDQVTRGLVLSNAANLYTQVGDLETAEAFYTDAINIARDLRDVHSEGIRQGNLAWYYVQTGRPSKALDLFEQALSITRKLDDPLLVAIQTNNQAYARAQQGEPEAALQGYAEAQTALERLEAVRWMGVLRANRGETLTALGRLEAAESELLAALEISQAQHDRENLIRARYRLAALYLRQGRLEAVEGLALEAYEDARRIGYKRAQAAAAQVAAELYLARDDRQNALRYLSDAVRNFQIMRDPASRELAARLHALQNPAAPVQAPATTEAEDPQPYDEA
ncbi:MAG: tetratricopeptide repeat protein, partial [Anaerolineae bacterium]|nr:tetratricopeptide repeat protein [Anaerolineae bacterium]